VLERLASGRPTGELLQLCLRPANNDQRCDGGDVSLPYGRIALWQEGSTADGFCDTSRSGGPGVLLCAPRSRNTKESVTGNPDCQHLKHGKSDRPVRSWAVPGVEEVVGRLEMPSHKNPSNDANDALAPFVYL
jgi:hypothetical protein